MELIRWDSLIPKDLFKGFPKLDMTGWDLAADVYEKNGNLIVEMHVPGAADKFDIAVKNGMLCVKGSREKKTEIEDKNYYRKEIHRGRFERSITLPDIKLKAKEIKASQTKGILKIVIPKA